jgi:polyketide cyclase/dehydrase/lipid transport protein
MKRRSFWTILPVLATASVACLGAEPSPSSGSADDWKLASKRGGLMLYSRLHSGSSLKEFKAVGEIDAPTRAVHNVIDDFEEYPKFMPFMVECRLVKQESDATIGYQRLSPKIVCDRDYTLRIRKKSWPGEGGLVYADRWEPANELGPAERPGTLRVKLCEGGWLLEPAGANKTRATYSIFTDNGGTLPAFIANAASEIGIRKVFIAVRKQVKNPKYSAE